MESENLILALDDATSDRSNALRQSVPQSGHPVAAVRTGMMIEP
jgi:hypothetical protein